MHSTLTSLPICTASEREEISLALELLRITVTDNPFIPLVPTEPQAVFLTAPVGEIMYGGAGGGGKSIALLMGALQYVHVPRYAALLLRRTYADLALPDGLIPLSHQWLSGTAAHWHEQQKQWLFPSGASLTFGYLENERDKFRYKGPSFQFIGFDELTGFAETQYRFLFQRLRKPTSVKVPLRMRSATNPGDIGHDWVKKRFIDATAPDRLFVPARLEDNPYLDAESYDESLAKLDPVTRRQFRHGDWHVRPEGGLFKAEWFTGRTIDAAEVPPLARRLRYWDLAATKKSERLSNDPDWAVGCLLGRGVDGLTYILDARRFRESPQVVEERLMQTADRDGVGVSVRIEQEPGSSSKLYINGLARMLPGHDVQGVPSLTDKLTRARPASAACERGDIRIVRGNWVEEFLDELCAFPMVAHDDQVDAFTGAYNALAGEVKLEYRDPEITIIN